MLRGMWTNNAARATLTSLAIGAVVAGCGSTKSDGGGSTAAESPTASAAASTASKPSTPAVKLSLKDRLRKAVIDANLVGENDVHVTTLKTGGGKYEIVISHELGDNLSKGLIRSGAKDDAKKILHDLFTGPDRNRVGYVTVQATTTLSDKLGNESKGSAFTVGMDGATGRKINWANEASVDFGALWDKTLDIIG